MSAETDPIPPVPAHTKVLVEGESQLIHPTWMSWFNLVRAKVNVISDAIASLGVLGILKAMYGGTGFNSYTVGDTLYADTTTTLAKLSIGTDGQVYTVVAGIPGWADGGSGSGEAVSKEYTQVAHGLTVGSTVNHTGGVWALADSDVGTTMCDGFISEVVDADTIVVTFFGVVTLTAAEWLARNADGTNLVADEYYWQSTTAGKITKTQPTTGFIQAVGKAESTTVFRVLVGPVFSPAGSSSSDFTDWANTTNTITAVTTSPTKGTVVRDKVYWRRVGDSMEIRIDYQQSTAGTAGSGMYLFLIPDGKTIDSSKVALSTATDTASIVGTGIISDQASYSHFIFVRPYDTTKVRLGDIVAGVIGSANKAMSAAQWTVAVTFTVPITEWA